MFRRDFQLPSGVGCYGDKPDVVICGARKIGIEITNFFLEPGHSASSEQRQRPRRTEAITAAQKFFQKQTGKNIEFTFGFDKARPIKNPTALAKTHRGSSKKTLHATHGRNSTRLASRNPRTF